MASVKKIETTVGSVRIESLKDGGVMVTKLVGGEMDIAEVDVNEVDLIDAVLEYAHERGLRRMRKVKATGPKAMKPRKPRQQKPTADEQQGDPFADTPAAASA